MATYSVLVEGSGFEFQSAEGTAVRGFFVTRLAKARAAEDAALVAKALVEEDWTHGKLAHLGIRPKLEASEVARLGLISSLRVKDTGYVFHPGY
jgi:hypothetical protein